MPWLSGSVLWELVYDGPFAGNVDKRVKTIWAHIRDVYDALECSKPVWAENLDMFRPPRAFGCLKGKAAEHHHLLPILRDACRRVGVRLDKDKHRQKALDILTEIYDTFRAAGLRLTDMEVDRVASAYDNCLLHYKWLTKHSLTNGCCLTIS